MIHIAVSLGSEEEKEQVVSGKENGSGAETDVVNGPSKPSGQTSRK